MTHRWLVNAFRSTSHLPCASEEGFETLHKQWLSLCVISHLICCTERVLKIGHLRDNVGVNRHGVTYRNMDTVRSTSRLFYTPKESFEKLHMQWMTLIVVDYSIFHTERIPII